MTGVKHVPPDPTVSGDGYGAARAVVLRLNSNRKEDSNVEYIVGYWKCILIGKQKLGRF